MYLPSSYNMAVILMFITMLCWGSWANTAKLDKNWRFELFYWDYATGVLLTSLLFALTLGSIGSLGTSFFNNIANANMEILGKAFAGGVIFNIANILLVAAISIAGMSVAFPIGIGIALIMGTLLSYLVAPQGNIFFLSVGITLVLLAIILAAIAYKKKDNQENKTHTSKKGILISIISGILMSLFYPLVASTMKGSPSLTPYTAVFFFALGVFVSNWIVNYIFMRIPITGSPLSMQAYFKGSLKQHLIGIFGGFIWCVGMSFNIIAATNAGPAIAYAFGQGATLIAAIWGVFVWKEFAKTKQVYPILVLMFLFYLLGLISIGMAKLL